MIAQEKKCNHRLLECSVSQGHVQLGQEKTRAEEERLSANSQLKDLTLQRDQLKGKVQEQNLKVDQLNQVVQELKTTERLLEQRAKQLEVRSSGNATAVRLWILTCPHSPERKAAG